MASIEELLRRLLQNAAPTADGAALDDPEFQLDVTGLLGQQNNAEAEALMQQSDAKSRFERMRRAAERQLPKEIENVRESAAARGLYNAGGRIETEGAVQKETADYVAQTAESQTNELNEILRGLSSRRNEVQQGISLAQQNAARRALERARNTAAPEPVNTPVSTQPVNTPQPIMPEPTYDPPPVAAAPIRRPTPVAAPRPAAKTPAQLEQERRWAAYVKYNPENARRVVLASRKR